MTTEAAVLYSFRRCPYAMRARLALAISGLPFELREITLRQKPESMLAASPKGTVPVLVLPSGAVIDESLAIMQWALQQHDPENWLGNPSLQEETLALVAHNDGAFKRHLDRYKYPNRYADEHALQAPGAAASAFAEVHRTAGAVWLGRLEELLQSGYSRDWLFGSQRSLADMAVLPFVRQFAHTDAAWFTAQPWPALLAWLANFEASALFAQIMQKHPLWSSSSNPLSNEELSPQ